MNFDTNPTESARVIPILNGLRRICDGIPWTSMTFPWISIEDDTVPLGSDRILMDLHAIRRLYNRMLWISMTFAMNPQELLGNHHGIQ